MHDADGAARWLAIAALFTGGAFSLLVAGQTNLAAYAGLAAGLVVAVAGVRVATLLGRLPEDDRIAYPYDGAQRGRRLAAAGLLTALGLAGFVIAPGFSISLLGNFHVLLGGLAILGPPLTVALLVWTVDGLALALDSQGPSLPLVGAAASLGLALAVAVGAATTGLSTGVATLAGLGGVLPAVLVLAGLRRLEPPTAGRGRPSA